MGQTGHIFNLISLIKHIVVVLSSHSKAPSFDLCFATKKADWWLLVIVNETFRRARQDELKCCQYKLFFVYIL